MLEQRSISSLMVSKSEVFSFERLGVMSITKKTKWIEAMIRPFELDDDPSILVMVKDQTPFRKLEERKIKNRLNSLLMTSMSHELRTPLHIMSTMVQLIESKTQDPEVLSFCTKASVSAELLTYLINGILDYYQIQSHSFKMKFENVDIYNIIQKAAKLVKEQIRPEVTLKIITDPSLPKMLTIDAARFPLILTTLLGNAAKYTFAGYIHVYAKFCRRTRALICRVKDTGIGISSGLLNSLFEFFHQLPNNNTSENSSRLQHGNIYIYIYRNYIYIYRNRNGTRNRESIKYCIKW